CPHSDRSRNGTDNGTVGAAKTHRRGSDRHARIADSSCFACASWLAGRQTTRCFAFTSGSIIVSRSCSTGSSEDSMNATGIPLKGPGISVVAGDTEQLERAYIDASTRVPVLMFYTSAIAWLILGTLLAGFVSFKLHSPDLLSDISFLTWGRVRPAHMNVMV